MKTPAGHTLVEFPYRRFRHYATGFRSPVRLFPFVSLLVHALTRWDGSTCRQVAFYLLSAPVEIDTNQPRVQAGRLSRFRHYQNLDRCEQRLVALLKDFSFDTAEQVLAILACLPEQGMRCPRQMYCRALDNRSCRTSA